MLLQVRNRKHSGWEPIKRNWEAYWLTFNRFGVSHGREQSISTGRWPGRMASGHRNVAKKPDMSSSRQLRNAAVCDVFDVARARGFTNITI